MPNKNNKLAKGIDENSMLCTGKTEGQNDTCGVSNLYFCIIKMTLITIYFHNLIG